MQTDTTPSPDTSGTKRKSYRVITSEDHTDALANRLDQVKLLLAENLNAYAAHSLRALAREANQQAEILETVTLLKFEQDLRLAGIDGTRKEVR